MLALVGCIETPDAERSADEATVSAGVAMVRASVQRSSDNTRAALWTLAPLEHWDTVSAPIPSVVPRRDTQVPELQESTDAVDGGAWLGLVEQYVDWDAARMIRIVECESHFDENAVSPDGANVGGFQLNVVHGFTYEQMTDPATATELAHDLWQSSGYGAWACDRG